MSVHYLDKLGVNFVKKLTALSYVVGSVAALSILTGCESTPELSTSLIPEQNRKAHKASIQRAEECPLHLASLRDTRQNKVTFFTSDTASDTPVLDLLTSRLDSMNVSGDTPSQHSVKIELQRVFVKTLGESIVATVVLGAQYRPSVSSDYSPQAIYKGKSVKTNGDDANTVIGNAVSAAVKSAAMRIKRSILHNCDAKATSVT
ncbi:hypothetical protein [Alteromonas sp. A079]|uniref:hypothetical protein n=1 Tax=Alteromonas sp. A079 TaxID=3410268 RepID=UPI003BA043DC